MQKTIWVIRKSKKLQKQSLVMAVFGALMCLGAFWLSWYVMGVGHLWITVFTAATLLAIALSRKDDLMVGAMSVAYYFVGIVAVPSFCFSWAPIPYVAVPYITGILISGIVGFLYWEFVHNAPDVPPW